MTKAQRDRMWDDIFARMIVEFSQRGAPYEDSDFIQHNSGTWSKIDDEWADCFADEATERHMLVVTYGFRVAREAAMWADVAVQRAQLDEQARTLRPPTKPAMPTKEFKQIPKDMT